MQTIQTRELTGDQLLNAVAAALQKSYTELSFEIGALGLAQLQDYLEKHPDVDLGYGYDDNVEDIRDAILAHHESLLPGENDLREACQEDLWPLCETLLERYDISLEPRVEVATGRKLWLADVDGLRVEGSTPREAIIRYYVSLKLGNEVTLND